MSYSVLIVEDHPFQHQYLLNLFHDLGNIRVEAARDGKEAFDWLQKQSFDLVLTDLLMPGMDGVQLIQRLSALPCKPALAIMSAASRRMIVSASLVAQSMGVDVIGQLSKPVNPAAVRTLMCNLDKLIKSDKSPANVPLTLTRETLHEAMQSGALQAWFQPKKSLHDGLIVAAEALARWEHPELGLLMPADFLPSLVRLGLEKELLLLFIKQTIAAQANWARQGYDIPVSINLPTHLLDDDDLADELHDYVCTQGGITAKLGFELMECSTTQDISKYYAGACRLRMKGFGLAQDDFGQGFSSYFNLVSTPFTELKIDRALVHGCVENENLASALASIVALGRQLGLEVVAEGVESQEELALLRKLNCDRVQGFLISRAVSSGRFGHLLHEDSPPRLY
ncbi:EAL domain-containing response regulator [Pseudomonas kulmbachensis]|uniref:EAL domain-containing protein n=1 Tax=Pseudomonas kulmbachensis TaxID=3043408 RepID=A0ABW7LUC9_9PSED